MGDEMKEAIIKHKHILSTPSGRHKVVISGHHFGTFDLEEAIRVRDKEVENRRLKREEARLK
jgi:hypothetical protein